MQKQPLRIAIFTALYAPIVSGITFGVHQRVRWLLQQGHHVFLIHPEIDGRYANQKLSISLPGLSELRPFPNFSAYAYPTRPSPLFWNFPEPQHHRHWSDTDLLATFGPDIVIVEESPQMRGFYSLFLGGYGRPVGLAFKRQTGVPTVSLFHTDILAYCRHYLGKYSVEMFRPAIAALAENFSKSYDVNFWPSRELLAKYRKMKFQHSEYLPFQGIDCQKFHPSNVRYDPIPDDTRPMLLFVGRLALEKNVTLLLKAFAEIIQKVHDVHLVIVGNGPQAASVRRDAQPFGSAVTLWGESTGTEILGWFARADVFLNPSVTENFCTTNMEALASGTPVVAARSGGNIEQISQGHNGLLVDPNSASDLANNVVSILENAELKAKLTKQARPSVAQFDWLVCMEKFEDKLYQLLTCSLEGYCKRCDVDKSNVIRRQPPN